MIMLVIPIKSVPDHILVIPIKSVPDYIFKVRSMKFGKRVVIDGLFDISSFSSRFMNYEFWWFFTLGCHYCWWFCCSMCPSVHQSHCPAIPQSVCLSVQPEGCCHCNSLRISGISLKSHVMRWYTIQEADQYLKWPCSANLCAHSMELLNFPW